MADNRAFDISDDRYLEQWLDLCMGSRMATGYAVRKVREPGTTAMTRLVLFWHKSSEATDYHPFPSPVGYNVAAELAQSWLTATVPSDEYPDDVDGDVKSGFRIYSQEWGHVDGDPYAFVAISPIWMIYGK